MKIKTLFFLQTKYIEIRKENISLKREKFFFIYIYFLANKNKQSL